MCLEVIQDLLSRVDDRLVSDLDNLSTALAGRLTEEDRELLSRLEDLHRERAREWAKRALFAGLAMGRGLARFFPATEDDAGNYP